MGFYNNASVPWNRGFHSTLGYLGGMEDHWTKQKSKAYDIRQDGLPDPSAVTTANGNTSLYSTKLYRLRAVDIIADHAANEPRDTPLFIYMALQACHAPLQAPAHWLSLQEPLARFGGKKYESRRTYAAMVQQVDFAVGKVVSALKDAGMYNNTLLVLSAE